MPNIRQKILTAAILMTMCVTCGAPDGDVQIPIAVRRQAYKGDQTTTLEGGNQGLTGYLGSVVVFATGAVGPDGLPLDRVFVDWAELRAIRTLPSQGCVPSQTSSFSGKQLAGSILLAAQNSDTPNRRLRIDAITEHLTPRPDGKPGSVAPGEFEYQLTLLSLDSTAEMGKLCGDPSTLSLFSNPSNMGLPFTGRWNREGFHETADDNRFSFGCLGGALVECLDFGYRPWEEDMRRFHQACTRMARADYCGNGRTSTLKGTPINVYDFEAGEPPSPQVPQVNVRTTEPGFLFEAAWGTSGADGASYCLSKFRWDTTTLDACPDRDPRLFVPGAGRVFCENHFFSLADYRKNGAVLFNDSLRIDAGLVRWQKRGLSTEFFTSAKYVVRTQYVNEFPTRVPALATDENIRRLDYACPPTMGSVPCPRVEGTIFRHDVPPEITNRPGVIALRNFYSPSREDYYLTTDPAPTFSHVNDMRPIDWEPVTEDMPSGIEGYIYERHPALGARGVQLNSWWHPTRGEHLTTTDPSWNGSACKITINGSARQRDCLPGLRHYPPTPDDPNGEYQYVREEGFLPR